ncbi:MAG: DUF4860 domain-containing protein [Clostridia bacterium]|nr:DUF4860 domain-containing protein [Clostridia bacterium]
MSDPVKLPQRRIQNLFIVLLLAVFAVSCILITAMGARAYRSTVAASNRENSGRILAAVVRGAARSGDGDRVSIERNEELGISCLAFTEEEPEGSGCRRLYCRDGYLMESYTSGEREFDWESGEALCPAAAFEPRLEGSLLAVTVTDAEGNTQEIRTVLRVGGGSR